MGLFRWLVDSYWERIERDPRSLAAASHAESLKRLGADHLLELFVHEMNGFHVPPELRADLDGVAVHVLVFKLSPGEILFRVNAHPRRFCDGFAIRDGEIVEMTDDDWGLLD